MCLSSAFLKGRGFLAKGSLTKILLQTRPRLEGSSRVTEVGLALGAGAGYIS